MSKLIDNKGISDFTIYCCIFFLTHDQLKNCHENLNKEFNLK